MAWTDEARRAAAEARARGGAFKTKSLASGKIGVFRTGTGTLVAKFPNQASADRHVAMQTAEDHAWRVQKIGGYLAERAARPPQAPAPQSPQLDMFGGESHVHSIAGQHGISIGHLK